MLAVRLIQLVEAHAEDLVLDVLTEVRRNPHTPAFARVPEADLRHRLLDLYKHLGDWIGDPADIRIEQQYREVGRRRVHDGVPIEEVVYALLIAKERLYGFIARHGQFQSVVELYGEEQLHQMVGRFFDRALYYTVKGYEDERRRLEASGEPAGKAAVAPPPRWVP